MREERVVESGRETGSSSRESRSRGRDKVVLDREHHDKWITRQVD